MVGTVPLGGASLLAVEEANGGRTGVPYDGEGRHGRVGRCQRCQIGALRSGEFGSRQDRGRAGDDGGRGAAASRRVGAPTGGRCVDRLAGGCRLFVLFGDAVGAEGPTEMDEASATCAWLAERRVAVGAEDEVVRDVPLALLTEREFFQV